MSATTKTQGTGESVLEKIKALEAQIAELRESAKTEALDKAKQAVSDLNSLGFNYRLVEGAASPDQVRGARAPRKAETQTPKRQIRDEPCKICHFKTSPPHDARSHRSQIPQKPFSVEELMEKGLSRVG